MEEQNRKLRGSLSVTRGVQGVAVVTTWASSSTVVREHYAETWFWNRQNSNVATWKQVLTEGELEGEGVESARYIVEQAETWVNIAAWNARPDVASSLASVLSSPTREPGIAMKELLLLADECPVLLSQMTAAEHNPFKRTALSALSLSKELQPESVPSES